MSNPTRREVLERLSAGPATGSEVALHRSEADLEQNKASGFYRCTEIAVDQLVQHVLGMK
ncbi:MAG: hypothetical protein AB7Q69_09450 [Gemmatimonadales bacterium]